jgi:hypothetical protein
MLRAASACLFAVSLTGIAQAPLFQIARIERVQVPLREGPGQAALIYAKFRWQGQDNRSWVASLNESHCAPNLKIRIGGIGWQDLTTADIGLASYADKDYEWQWQGPKPTDQLFTAICQSRK